VKVGAQPLYLKIWHLTFDVRFEWLEYVLVWVKLLRLSIILCLDEAFSNISSSLGIYYEVNTIFQDYGSMSVACILVLDMREGLEDLMVLKKKLWKWYIH
jgi:hypothetical protein